MKATLKKGAHSALLMSLLASGSIFAMELSVPKVQVFVKHSLWSATISPSLQVTYTTKGKSNTRKVNPGQSLDIGPLSNLGSEEPIVIEGYGEWKAASVAPLETYRPELISEAHNLGAERVGELILEVNWKGWISNKIMIEYSVPEKGIRKKKLAHPWHEFPAMKKWYSHVFINPDDVLKAKSWEDELLRGWYPVRATIAEDVYRYILNLTKNYTQDDIVRSYKDLAVRLHPDKFPEEDRETATTIMQLLNKAKEGLEQALKDKQEREEKEWTKL